MKKTPLKRTPFKAKPRPSFSGVKPEVKRSTLKTKGPRMTPIRRAAMGEECLLALPGICNRDPATVVLCHSNSLADGKGMGLKAPDTAACFGCSACHDLLDGRRPRPEGMTLLMVEGAFVRAVARTHERLKQKGIPV